MNRHPEHFGRFQDADHWHRVGGPLMMLLFLAFVALGVWAVVRLVRTSRGTGPAAVAAAPAPAAGWAPTAPATVAVDPALAQARMRYANGQLPRADYLQIVRDLGGTVPPEDVSPVDPPAAPPAAPSA